MTWRGSTTVLDRILACLPYLLPLFEAIIGFSRPFFTQFPALTIILLPLQPLLTIYSFIAYGLSLGGFAIGSMLIFFGLYFFVVRNESINHFIRFNTMQAILLDIGLVLCGLILSLILKPISVSFIVATLMNTIFLGIVAAVTYSVVQTVMGKYAEIPTISDAVYMQVR